MSQLIPTPLHIILGLIARLMQKLIVDTMRVDGHTKIGQKQSEIDDGIMSVEMCEDSVNLTEGFKKTAKENAIDHY
jgi:hypothetical protein